MAERCIQFGPGQRLLGILNFPENRVTGPGEVAFLMLNVGVTQRIGPRRLNVRIARQLASQGLVSLRFDLSGIGDSGAAGAGDDYRQQSVADLRSAMDALAEETGICRFAVLGICSGAVNAYRVTSADERVVGVMMYDGFAYPNWATAWVHDWRRLSTMSFREFKDKLRRRLPWLSGSEASQPRPVSIFYVTRDNLSPDQQAFAEALSKWVARGTRVLIGYSGSMLSQYNHHGQFRRVFASEPWLPAVQCDYMPDIDHIPTTQAAQRRFLAWIASWAEQWAAAPSSSKD